MPQHLRVQLIFLLLAIAVIAAGIANPAEVVALLLATRPARTVARRTRK